MDPRSKLAITVAGTLLAVGGIHYANQQTAQTSDLGSAVPAATFLAARIDVDTLRRTGLLATLSDALMPGGAPLQSLEKECGFDPLSRVSDVVFAVPEEDGTGDFGVALSVRAKPDELRACSKAVQSTTAADAPKTSHGFHVFGAGAQGNRAQLAVRPAGSDSATLVVAKGAWLESMLSSLERGGRDAKEHESASLALGSDVPRTVSATVLLPDGMRKRLMRELGTESRSAESKSTMEGVLGVRAVALALGPMPKAEGELGARALLRCDQAEQCTRVKTLIEHKRLQASQDIGARLAFGPLLDSLTVQADGSDLRIEARAPITQVSRALRLLGLVRERPAVATPSDGRAQPSFVPKPDLTVSAPRPSARPAVPAPSALTF
jgi:hypothetical protein